MNRVAAMQYLTYLGVRLAAMIFQMFPINANLRTAGKCARRTVSGMLGCRSGRPRPDEGWVNRSRAMLLMSAGRVGRHGDGCSRRHGRSARSTMAVGFRLSARPSFQMLSNVGAVGGGRAPFSRG
jgi:hypothetical protein